MTAGLNRVKDFLYDQEALVRRQDRSGASEQAAELERLEAQLRAVVEELRARRRGGASDLADTPARLDALRARI